MVVVDIFKLAEERYFVQVRLIGPNVLKLSQDFLSQCKRLILWDNQPNEVRVIEGYLLAFNARWRVGDGEVVIEHGLKGAVPTETDCIDWLAD